MLFSCFERDFLSDSGEHLRRDVEERGNVLQVKVFDDARATLHQQVVAFAGCSAMKVEIAGTELEKNMLGNDGT